MKNMKFVSVMCASMSLMFGAVVLADEHGHGSAPVKAEKKSGRKKRVLMCKDCGKPESKCDCPEEKKAAERAEAEKEAAKDK